MIYRGEFYHGPNQKSEFVVYGSAKQIAMMMDIIDKYCELTKEYDHPYCYCSQQPLWRYWWWTITDPIRNIIAEIEAPDGCYNEDLNCFQRIAYWWNYRNFHKKKIHERILDNYLQILEKFTNFAVAKLRTIT